MAKKEKTRSEKKEELLAKLKEFGVGEKTLIFSSPYRNYLAHPKANIFYDGELFKLRYHENANSIFAEDQPEEAIKLAKIFIDEGGLVVNKREIPLASFLLLQLWDLSRSVQFSLENKEDDAKAELTQDDLLLDTLTLIRDCDLTDAEAIYSIMYGEDPTILSAYEIRRALNILAKNGSCDLIKEAMNDSMTMYKYKYKAGIVQGHLVEDPSGLIVRWAKSKKAIINVNINEDLCDEFCAMCLTKDGQETYDTLLDLLNK